MTPSEGETIKRKASLIINTTRWRQVLFPKDTGAHISGERGQQISLDREQNKIQTFPFLHSNFQKLYFSFFPPFWTISHSTSRVHPIWLDDNNNSAPAKTYGDSFFFLGRRSDFSRIEIHGSRMCRSTGKMIHQERIRKVLMIPFFNATYLAHGNRSSWYVTNFLG